MVLKRIVSNADGTFGVLLDMSGTIPFALTLEDKWKDNAPFESCIPSGVYDCKRIHSLKFGETFEVVKVVNRTNILFHAGNIDEDTQGCILIGEEFGELYGKTAILSSRRGFNEFMERLNGHAEFLLYIVEGLDNGKHSS